ncbi:MAG TPA: hypothetical protein VEG38_09750 [Acidimicrobiia bacterium]|nr:hypothetical protein [Acidimicrobiia bacterium]
MSAGARGNAVRRAAGRRLCIAVIAAVLGASLGPGVPAADAAGASATAGSEPLSGGGAMGRGVFLTYGDRDTVIEGGTVAPLDLAAPVAQAAIDFTGLGFALAALGYSPYSDAAGVINAFGGTELPLGSVSERSRAKVTGRPPQESAVQWSESAGRAQARLRDGPTAEARTSAATTPDYGVAAQIGEIRATVTTVNRTADSKVTVVLRSVRIGELSIDTIRLAADALADGATGRAAATAVVEGVSLAGTPVRITPKGLEPVGASAPDLSLLNRAGIEILSAGGTLSQRGDRQSEARAIGPRIRFRSSDGRLVAVVLGEAVATSTRDPRRG